MTVGVKSDRSFFVFWTFYTIVRPFAQQLNNKKSPESGRKSVFLMFQGVSSEVNKGGIFLFFTKRKGLTRLYQTYPFVVEVAGFEPTASWSRTKRATNCATPRYCV